MREYEIVPTKGYRKDYKRLRKSGMDMAKLEKVINTLASGHTLDVRYRDHALRGTLQNTHECHIGPDWLLRYIKNDNRLILILIASGDHRQVLGVE